MKKSHEDICFRAVFIAHMRTLENTADPDYHTPSWIEGFDAAVDHWNGRNTRGRKRNEKI